MEASASSSSPNPRWTIARSYAGMYRVRAFRSSDRERGEPPHVPGETVGVGERRRSVGRVGRPLDGLPKTVDGCRVMAFLLVGQAAEKGLQK